MKRTSPRNVRFDLGDFVLSPDVAQLLPYAEVSRLVLRHGRGDWGQVDARTRKENEVFAHPRYREHGAHAKSVHVVRNAKVTILTIQGKRRRQTRIFLS